MHLGVSCKDVFEVFKTFACTQLIDTDNDLKMCTDIPVIQIFEQDPGAILKRSIKVNNIPKNTRSLPYHEPEIIIYECQ